MYYMMADEQQ